MEWQHGITKSRHAAAQLFLAYISYLISCAGGFLGPVHCVILSRGRWHSHSVNRILWIGTVDEESSPGVASHRARISRSDYSQRQHQQSESRQPLHLFFQTKPRPRNEFQHRVDIGHNCRLGLGLAQAATHVLLRYFLQKHTHLLDFLSSLLHTLRLVFDMPGKVLVVFWHHLVPLEKYLLWERSFMYGHLPIANFSSMKVRRHTHTAIFWYTC